MTNGFTNYLYQFLSFRVKQYPYMETAIKGDLTRYASYFDCFWQGPIPRRDLDEAVADGHERHIRFHENKDISIEVSDASKFYNHLQIHFTNKCNNIEFIASHFEAEEEEPTYKEESEYIFDQDTGEGYIYYSKISYVDKEETNMIFVYDRRGMLVHRSLNHGTFYPDKVKKIR